ncbi:LPD7 domain-containing protein [Yersinia pekkanenii]|uniref:DNA primase TraC n=1 Tax=Yersinia pekkanenii TaxID=1288385 RepID=A0A0T9QWB7_9GAMM|nr:LPD7 domain-containing protein [Yersinia pekkanenii]CNI31956.1 DNA primase TraC [Yersinia pekkanenii]CRY68961.1 DNA primase TraC [Yersinia pekkanenii]
MKNRTYLTIMPNNKKDALRAAGRLPDGGYPLEYDRSQKLWFAKEEADLEKVKPWLPENTVTGHTHTVAENMTPAEEFAEVLKDAGFIFPANELPEMDGKRRRVQTEGDKDDNKSGVYQGYMDGRPAGWYQNHRASEGKVNWTSTGSYEYDPAESMKQRALAAQKRWVRELKARTDYTRIAKTLTRQWSKMPPAPDTHAYLSRKGVSAASGVRLDIYDNLVIPLRNTAGELRTLQYIKPDGTKNLKKDAEKTGNFFVVGGELSPQRPILYAEGYATAASLHQATGIPVVMTVDAGNMVTVSRNLKALYPDTAHIILGEDDFTKTDNKGLNKAREAAAAIDGTYIIPQFTESERTQAFAGTGSFSDFNDIHSSRGIDAVRDQLSPVLDPLLPDWRQTFTEEHPMPDTHLRQDDPVEQRPEPADIAEYAAYMQQESFSPYPENENHVIVQNSSEPTEAVSAPADAEIAPIYTENEPEIASSQPLDAETHATDATQHFEDTGDVLAKTASQPELTVVPAGSAEAIPEAGMTQTDISPTPSIPHDDKSTAGFKKEFEELTSNFNELINKSDSLDVASLYQEINLLSKESIGLRNYWMSSDSYTTSAGFEEPSIALEESLRETLSQKTDTEHAKPSTPDDPRAEPASFASMLNVNDTLPEDESHQEEMASSEQPQYKSVDNSIHIDPVDSAEDDQPRRAIPVDLDALLQNVTHEYEGNTVVYFHEGVRAFVDHGNHITMATPEASQNVTLVLAALLVARQHYHGKIELTGSDEFKQRAINLIAEHNLELVLKNPIQQLMLDEARKLLAQQRNDTPVSTPSVDGIVLTPANQTKPSASAVPGTQAPTVHATGTPQSQQRPQQDAAQPETTGLTGKLLAHGEAPYDFDDTNSMSYHVKMRTADGEKVIWGKELNGALADSGMNIGDIISLRCLGQQPVTVNSPVKDETGKILRWEKIDAMRNQWEVKSAIDNRLLVPDRQQAFPPASLLAYDMASFQQVQQTVIAASGITLPPLTNHSALLWLQPDGRGAAQHGNPQTAKLPIASQDSGTPVMTGHLPDGQLSLQLVKAHGDYLQGIVLHKGEYQHVLGQLCTRENGSRYLTLNIVEPDGLRPIGHGNAVNQVRGAVVAYDTFVFRLSGDNEKVVAKLDSPEKMEAVLHKKLGFTKQFTPVAPVSDAIVKAENKPLARPDNAPRPGM